MRPALEDRRNLRRWRARLCERREFGYIDSYQLNAFVF